MTSRKKASVVVPNVPKAVLKRLARADTTSVKERLVSIIKACLLDPKTSKRLEHEVELVAMASTHLSIMIQVGDQYFSIKVQEHR